MRLFPKQLLSEEFTYHAEKPVDDLKEEMQKLFDKTRGFNLSVNLAGKFTSAYAFEVTPKYQFGYINGLKRDAVYLVGKLTQGENNKAKVTLLVRPNSMFLIVFFVSIIWGLFRLLFVHNQSTTDIIANLAFVVAVPFIATLVARFAKKRITDRFVRVFGLKEVDKKA